MLPIPYHFFFHWDTTEGTALPLHPGFFGWRILAYHFNGVSPVSVCWTGRSYVPGLTRFSFGSLGWGYSSFLCRVLRGPDLTWLLSVCCLFLTLLLLLARHLINSLVQNRKCIYHRLHFSTKRLDQASLIFTGKTCPFYNFHCINMQEK